jgi:glutamate 5-kinase
MSMQSTLPEQPLPPWRRAVLKVGSNLLAADGGGLTPRFAEALASFMASSHAGGRQVVLVSSGAVAAGRALLHARASAGRDLAARQAMASLGQAPMIGLWQSLSARPVAQVLLTHDDLRNRRRYLNARATLLGLLALDAVPVVNENDTVATEEIRYGDNDRLAARVAQMIGADLLVLLSDIDGLYTADPRRDPDARHIPVVSDITPEIEAMAGGANEAAGVGTGGMATKIAAARIAHGAGCATLITLGRRPGSGLGPLEAVGEGARATVFEPNATPAAAYKQWIAGALAPQGALTVDAGAVAALRAGKSLLPAGVRAVDGGFGKGDAVVVVDEAGREVARGLAAYGAEEARAIQGRRSDAIEAVLGYAGRSVLIHRNDLVLVGG